MNKKIVLVLSISALLLSGCAAESSNTNSNVSAQSAPPVPTKTSAAAKTPEPDDLTPTGTPKPNSSTRTEVIWSDYDAGLQADIDQMTANQDCQGLQSYFGMVAATEDSVKSRTGHGNEALEKYLNEAVAQSGCG